jgi:hypothetical protein
MPLRRSAESTYPEFILVGMTVGRGGRRLSPMTAQRRGADWRPNANETGVVTSFNMDVAGVGALGGAGWSGLRRLARRLGLPVAESPRPAPALAGSACARCGGPVLVGEAACPACGRAAPRPGASDAIVADVVAVADRRRRADRLLALLVAVVVGFGILLLAQTMERSSLQLLALRLWWAAGLFWGGFVLLARSWLDQ